MDAARTAMRLGAETVKIVYRRSEAELPARAEEVHHAKQEGVEFLLLTNPISMQGDENGMLQSMTCVRMELGEPDASGRRKPVEVAGSEFTFETDLVIFSVGTGANPIITQSVPGLELTSRGYIAADENGRTSVDGVWAGGDIVTGAATVIKAMGAGRKAAKDIHEWLLSR